jgi:hypothetical protein
MPKQPIQIAVGITAEASAERDKHLPITQSITFRATQLMAAGIRTRALVESRGDSAIVRRWIRAGAAAEGIDIGSW